MAFTVSKNANTVFGDRRVVLLRVSADAATQTIETGLKNVSWAMALSVSCTAASTLSAGIATDWRVAINSNASGVQSMGVLGISNAVSGDVKDIVVFGYEA